MTDKNISLIRGHAHANLSLESLAKLAFALDLKWECILIPRKAKIGVLSLADESGNCAICAVERATVTALGEPIPAEEEAYAAGIQIQTKEVCHELRIPA